MRHRLVGRRCLAGLWLVAALVLLAAYAARNPPAGRALAHLVPVAVGLVAVAALTGLGAPLARLLAAGSDRTLEALTALCLGTALTGIATLVQGFGPGFSAPFQATWYGLGLVLFARAAWRWRRWSAPAIRWTPWNVFAAIVIVVCLAPLLPHVSAPVASTDSLQYHLLIPKIYLQQDAIQRIPLLVEASYPSLAELNYLPVMRLAGDIPCKAVHFWLTIALLAGIGRLARQAAPDTGPLLAPALFLAMPVTLVHMGWAWNDFLFTLALVTALAHLARYHEAGDGERTGRAMLAAGVMAGIASWTKYTFVLFVFAAVPLVATGLWRWRWRLGHVTWLVAGVGLVCPLWLGQNWYLTHNPFYPFLHDLFPSPYWNAVADARFHESLRRFEIPRWGPLTYLTFPLHISLTPRIIEAHTSVVPLLLLPLVFTRSSTRVATLLKGYLGFFVLAWLGVQTENRSLLSVFAVLAVLGAAALERRDRPLRLPDAVVMAILGTAILTGLWVSRIPLHDLSDPVAWFIGRESDQAYLRRVSESQLAYEYLNRRDEVAGVLLVSLHGPYYLERPYLFSSFADPPVAQVLLGGEADAGAMLARLRQLGVSHVVINLARYAEENQRGLYSWSTADKVRFETLIDQYLEPLGKFATDVVLRVPDERDRAGAGDR